MSDQPAPDDSVRGAVRWLISVCIALIVVGSVVAFLLIEVCDDQVTSNGNVVRVCRHLGTADPPAVAVGIILLALLSVFFTEISGFGITLKREVREATKVAQTAHATALQNKEDIRETDSDLKEVSSRILAGQQWAEAEPKPAEVARGDPIIAALADEYNHIRLTMTRGDERTRQMTSIVHRMKSHLENIESFDLVKHLNNNDRGLRLAAYAYLYARPDPSAASALVDGLLEKEDKPFGQYWALLALERLCQRDPTALDHGTRMRLESYLQDLPPRTDRAVTLRRVLQSCSA